MKEEWLMPDAVVPVDAETTAALVAEIKRLIGVVGDLALQQASPKREWVGLTDEDKDELLNLDNWTLSSSIIPTVCIDSSRIPTTGESLPPR